MMGKRKEEAEDEEEVKHHYFFPKFLTSRNLLELEVCWSSSLFTIAHAMKLILREMGYRLRIRLSADKS